MDRVPLSQAIAPRKASDQISRGEAIQLEAFVEPGKVTLFQFFSAACMSCQAIEAPLKAYLGSHHEVVLKRLDIGFGDAPVAKQYELKEIPTFIVYDPAGKLAARVATREMGRLKQAIERAKSQE